VNVTASVDASRPGTPYIRIAWTIPDRHPVGVSAGHLLLTPTDAATLLDALTFHRDGVLVSAQDPDGLWSTWPGHGARPPGDLAALGDGLFVCYWKPSDPSTGVQGSAEPMFAHVLPDDGFLLSLMCAVVQAQQTAGAA
jgi:hypothetical protein